MLVIGEGVVQAMRDLNVDEQRIDAVIRALRDAESSLGSDSFDTDAHIRPASFGGSEAAQTLGFHHNLAHRVVADTLVGVCEDLVSFAASTRQALAYVRDADQSAADDLNRKRAIAEDMREVWQNSAGDRANRQSRNGNLGAGAQAATGSVEDA